MTRLILTVLAFIVMPVGKTIWWGAEKLWPVKERVK